MQARQSDRMARVQAFLNSFWKHESGGVRWFDPGRTRCTRTASAADRPARDSGGLGGHLDPAISTCG
jgi:hypothetical protein